MAEFLNKEANPQEKVSAKGKVPEGQQKLVEWDDSTDLGMNAIERAGIMAQAQTPAATAGESFAAGVGNSIIAAAVRKANSPQFNADPEFNAKQFTANDPKMKLYRPNGDEIEYLHDSVSVDDYAYRTEQILEQRDRDSTMSQNLAAGIGGMLTGDSPMILLPFGAAGIAGKVGFAARTALRVADVSTAVYAADQPGQSNAVAAVIASVAGLDQLFDIRRAMRASAAAASATRTAETAPTAAPVTSRTTPEEAVTGYSGADAPVAPAPRETPAIDPEVPAPATSANTQVENAVAANTATDLPEGLSLNVLNDVEHHARSGVRVPGMEVEVNRGDQLVGIVQAYRVGDDLQVSHAWVDNSLRGKGVGTSMYNELVKRATDAGYSNLLSDSSVTVSAQQMWRKLGATKTRDFKELTDGIEGQRYAVSADETSPLFTLDLKRAGFDPAAPTTRAARDVEAISDSTKAVREQAFDKPVTVRAGQSTKATVRTQSLVEHLLSGDKLSPGTRAILEQIQKAIPDMKVHLSADTSLRSQTALFTDAAEDAITLRAAHSAKGKVWNTVGDALDALDDKMSKIAVHELIHAATARTLASPEGAEHLQRLTALSERIMSDPMLTKELRYYASNPYEMLAGLADSPAWVQYLAKTPGTGAVSMLREMGQYIMRALGITAKGSALDDVLNTFEDVVRVAADTAGDTGFRSLSLGEMVHYAPNAQGAQRLLDDVKDKFAANFALYDNIAQGNRDLADLLVSDGAAVGARRPSVTDYKRNLTLEMDGAASIVEDAIVSAMSQRGVGFLDRFFQRGNFVTARRELEDKVARYLDDAYDAESTGRAVPVPDPEIAPIVAAYQKSGWATRWHDHMTAAGLIEDGKLVRSDYYFPRQYSYDKMRQMLHDGRKLDDFRDLFRQALRDTYPAMTPEVVQKVAREMTDGIYNGRAASGPMWKQLVNGLSNDELVMAMKQAGIPDAEIQSFMKGNVRDSGATSPARNLRQRNRFNMTKEYTVNGQSMRLADLLDTDLSKVMHGYTNRMSGRVGMAYAGINDLSELGKMIDEGKHALANPGKWEASVNDTIDFMLGGVAGGANNQLPELLRAAGNLANATMLKNSALYQITDTALAMKEFGMARVLRSMREQPWFKVGQVALQNPDMATRLDAILRGSIQKEMRFRWLSTYADDNLDLTRSSHWFNVSQNIGQAARHANAMSMVHRMQVNVNSGIVMDEISSMLKGDAEAFKRLERFGLERDVANRAIAANQVRPGAVLPSDLQMQIEVVGARMMDYVVQQVRTGETSHFAQFNPVGKLIVGYQSFALAATNKIMRRELNDAGWLGMAHIMAYQFPMMLLMTQAKYAMDGKTGQVKDAKWIADSALGMSVLGGLSLIQPLFTGDTPRHSLAATGYVANLLGLLQDVASGNVDAKGISQRLPLIQEFAPTRAIINNFGDD